MVSAGDNKDLILPQNSVTLIATTFPEAPQSDSKDVLDFLLYTDGCVKGQMDRQTDRHFQFSCFECRLYILCRFILFF